MLKKSLFGGLSVILMCTSFAVFAQHKSAVQAIGIYGDSAISTKGTHQKEVKQLGKILAQSKKKLLFDGQTNGLSGKLLQSAYESKGNIEIFSTTAEYEQNCPETHFCRQIPYTLTNTQERADKQRVDSADMYLILPGGLDSFTDFADLVAVQQKKKNSKTPATDDTNRSEKLPQKAVIGLLKPQMTKQRIKPIILLNSNHYWDNLREQFAEMKRQNIIKDEDIAFIGFAEKPKDVLPLAEKLIKQR